MPDADYFEVRCERCRTSFAPGTKQCLHCGGAIGRRLLGFEMPGSLGGRTRAEPDSEPASADARGKFFRVAMLVLVVISAIVRACAQ